MQYSNVPKFINPFYLTVCSFHLKWANVERVARASEAWCLDYVARRAELWRQGWVDPGWVFREIRAVNINKQHTDTWCGDITPSNLAGSHHHKCRGYKVTSVTLYIGQNWRILELEAVDGINVMNVMYDWRRYEVINTKNILTQIKWGPLWDVNAWRS